MKLYLKLIQYYGNKKVTSFDIKLRKDSEENLQKILHWNNSLNIYTLHKCNKIKKHAKQFQSESTCTTTRSRIY